MSYDPMNDPMTDDGQSDDGAVPDVVLECIDCKTDFIFTGGEKQFYAERGLLQPKRCKACRDKRRQQKAVNQ